MQPDTHDPIVTRPAARTLDELDAFLRARLLRLEAALGPSGAGVVADATRLCAVLAEACAYAPAGADARACEAALEGTLRGVYAWVFGALDAVFLGDYVRLIPMRLVGELAEHASAASMRALLDPSVAPLEDRLRELTGACARFAGAAHTGSSRMP
jgi:hypothetical protein